MIQDKNANAVRAVDSTHAAVTTVPEKEVGWERYWSTLIGLLHILYEEYEEYLPQLPNK